MKILFYLLVPSFCFCAKLPSSFKKCRRTDKNFNSCLSEAIENAVRQMTHPFPEVGLPNLEPLEIPALTIAAGQGPVAFQQNYKNLKVTGFTTVQCPKAEVNFEKGTIYVECIAPEVKMNFDYEVMGKLLLLPIFGKGPGTITIDKLHQTFIFNFEEYSKKNNKYYKVTSTKVLMDPGLIRFRLENLFNGEKTLAENVLKVMNENWKEVFADVKTSYEDAFGQVFTSLFNNLLTKVPAEELFLN